MRKVFRNTELQKHFEKEGYAVVSFLTSEDIKYLETIYYQHRVDEQTGIEITVWNKNYEVNKRISDLTAALIAERLKDTLIDYRPLYSGFVTKIPGKPSASPLHQDPAFVDERYFRSINVWTPLVETNEQNGALHVVKGSHRMLSGYRGFFGLVEYSYEEIKQEIVIRYGSRVETKLGQAVIYDTALLHYSLENTTDFIRIANTCLMVPKEATTIYYHYNRKFNSLDVYEINGNFLLSYFGTFHNNDEFTVPLLKRTTMTEAVKVTLSKFEDHYKAILETST